VETGTPDHHRTHQAHHHQDAAKDLLQQSAPHTAVHRLESLVGPNRIVLDASNNVLIANADAYQVLNLSPSHVSIASVLASRYVPEAIAVDAFDNLYVIDGHPRVLKLPAGGGSPTRLMPSPALSNPHGVAVDSSGNVHVSDSGNNKAVQLSPSGSLLTTLGSGSTTLSDPKSIAVDSAGNVYGVIC
jgi:serine/threonine-protein kinase